MMTSSPTPTSATEGKGAVPNVYPLDGETPQEFVHRIKKNYGIREDELDNKEKRELKFLFLTKKGEDAIKDYFNAAIESKSALGVVRFDFAKMQKEDVAFIKQNGLTPYDFTAEGVKSLVIKTKEVKNSSQYIEHIKKWIRTTY